MALRSLWRRIASKGPLLECSEYDRSGAPTNPTLRFSLTLALKPRRRNSLLNRYVPGTPALVELVIGAEHANETNDEADD